MSLVLLLEELAARRIELRCEDGRLRFRAPEGALTPELRERLAAQKPALVDHLNGRPPVEPEVMDLAPSAAQERLWFIHQLQGPNCTYNIPLALRLRGSLDRGALHAALDDLVRRHQSLRGGFIHTGETLRLTITRDLSSPWTEIDLAGADESARPGQLREHAAALARHSFDLAKAPLMRVALVRLGAEEHVLLLNFHHIAADGWSFGIILQELFAGYAVRATGHPTVRPPLAWQYSDYIAWQQQLRQRGTMDADLAFWRERLTGAPLCTTLPPDLRRPPVQAFAGGSVPLAVDAATTARLRLKARAWGASLNHLVLAATAVLTANFSGARDLVIGLPLANRSRRELEPIIGMFVGVVPLRLVVAPESSPAELVTAVKHATSEAMEHCHLPFDRLVEALAPKRDLSMSPVFQMAYNFLPPMETRTQSGGLQVEAVDVFGENTISKYDCTFYLDERLGALEGHIEYATSLYRRETVDRWAQAFGTVLHALADGTAQTLRELSVVAPAERAQIEAWCTGRVTPLPPGSPWERFAEVARARPDAIAVREDDRDTSFQALGQRAGVVSALLAARGVGVGARVGLLLPRGADYIAAMLGVLRGGAVFVPLDLAQPTERLVRLAAQAKLAAVVCRAGQAAADALGAVTVEICDDTWSEAPDLPDPVGIGHDDPVYMIFTSGSTGAPKVVEVPWRGLCNVVQAFSHAFALQMGERLTQLASPGFDASLFEMWPALLSGATLVIVPPLLLLDPPALRDWVLRERIAVHFSPTPLAEALLDLAWPASTPLRLLYTGGQALRKRPPSALPFRVVNNYGPTEISIVATWGVVEPAPPGAALPSIGRPIDNTCLAVVDEAGRRVAVGIVGELCVSGAGVALGYFGNPAATAGRFVTLFNEPARRWYRTGDEVRLMPGGVLEFMGRRDGQIKLRGYRIEVGEIEGELLRVPGIRQAAVRLEGEQLVAYVEGGTPDLPSGPIRAHLAKTLPGYMLPAHVVVVEKFPRQTNGKINLGAVPCFTAEAAVTLPATTTISAPGLEAAVARAWARVLQGPPSGPDENFFDAGGHSLMLVRLKEHIRQETGREISLLDLFRHPTIARQASFLGGGGAVQTDPKRPPARRAADDGGIAIIGMAGRFPGADNVETFWSNLRAGREAISFFSREELLAAGVPVELADRPDYVPANGILHAIDRFDAEFFGIPAREAEVMDPQHRLLLEEAWHAFEDAGWDPATITERVGVFVGSSLNGYLIENVLPSRAVVERLGGFAVMLGNDKDFAATRLSYELDLRGPSISVNTACSTSLVAVHQAVTALRDGQCELALAGGACVRSRQIEGYRYEDGGVLSRDGQCRPFDVAASGMVGGNGVALVLLKPLAAALADGDHIYAVIKGIAVNNDGADKVGFTAPGLSGQSAVIRDALERAGVDPLTVRYVEAHGTATQLGDTIEVAALAQNYASDRARAVPLYLGSVKASVGHLDAAAGVTGLIKTALCLRERTLVPSLHFQHPNPQIPWPGKDFQVCTQTTPWAAGDTPLRAAVSSLGIGGTNAHAVLEQAPPRPEGETVAEGLPRLLLFSGRNETALHANRLSLVEWCARNPTASLRDVAHTLAFGRRHWSKRQALCVFRTAELAAAREESAAGVERADSVAFMFSGMGTQRPGMGRALYGRSPVFTACIDECASGLQPLIGTDIREMLLADPEDKTVAARLNEPRFCQPTVFALEYALARFWMDLGLVPAVLVGHSLGEWVAACVAGVFTLPDALRLVCLRGSLMGAQTSGAMLEIGLTEAEVAARLPAELDIATVNAVDLVVVAGPTVAIDAFEAQLGADQVRCKRLQMTVAAHSSRMDPVLGALRAAIAAVPRRAPNPDMRVVSNLTGQYLEPARLQSPDYWTEQVRRCVRFADELGTVWAQPGLALLECGPAHALCNLALRDPRRPDARAIVASADGEEDPAREWRRILASAGTLWSAGLPVDLEKLFRLQGKGWRIPLPGYSFQRERYWLDAAPAETKSARPGPPAAEPRDEDLPPAAALHEDDTERRVMEIMREQLGPVRLGANSDFFLCGGDSLMAVRLTSRMGEVFGVQPTCVQIMQARTPAKIAALLENDPAADPGASETDRCLVRLWAGDEELPPIVLVHAVGGGSFIYRDLLQALASSHPVYGLQAPGLWDDAAPVAGLRAQAEHYYRCLIQAGIARPMMIGGSSYGGLVAYELARLYQQAAAAPRLVVLFDSPGPGRLPARLNSEAEIYAYLIAGDTPNQDFAAHLAQMETLDHAGRFARLLAHMRRFWMPHAAPVDVERLVRVFRQNLTNMWDWVPQPHEARLLFCKVRETGAPPPCEPEMAWVPLAPGGIEILPVPGDHSSMLLFPHVRQLAHEINCRLAAPPFRQPATLSHELLSS